MIKLEVISNIDELEVGFLMAKKTFADWEPFFDAWGGLWRESRLEMWNTGGASTGTPWPFYSKQTREHRYAAVKSSLFGRRMVRRDLLRWTPNKERLMPSFTEQSHPDYVEIIQGTRAVYGSKVPYAENHNEGTGRMPAWAGGYKIPRRPLTAMGTGLEMETQQLADRFAAAGIHAIDEAGRKRSGLSSAEVTAMLTGGKR